MRFFKHTALLMGLLAVLLPVPAAAAEGIDPEKPVTLTIANQCGEMPLPGVEFRICLVSTVDMGGELTPVPEFAEFSRLLDIRGENASAWEAAAQELEQYILKTGISPTDTARTDRNGTAVFPSGDAALSQGLYLVLGTRHSREGFVYSTSPFFLQLPGREDNSWVYDLRANAKAVETEETISVLAVKKWRVPNREDLTLPRIRVRLYRDGEEYDTVTLPKDGRWYYRWEGLNADHKWWVEEDPVRGYRGKVTKDGNTFVVENTSLNWETAEDRLPQTGQLWWPVPVLTAVGLLLMLLGLAMRRKAGREE